jgi:hypothetical protein
VRRAALALAVLLLLPALPGAQAGSPRTADSDNSFLAATEVPASGSRSGTLDLSDDRSDFWKFSAGSGLIIKAFIYIVEWTQATPDAVNFSLYLYDRNQKQVAASASSFQYETVSALAVAGGTYYLEARAVAGSGTYTLDWSVGEAQVIRNGDEIHGFLLDSGNHNSDWYRVELRGGPAPDRFRATMHADAGALFDLYFMDLWSEYSLWYDISWWSDPDEAVEGQATYAGWYYLWVSDYSGKGNYVLTVTVEAGQGDGDSEPAGARAVPYNSSFYGSVDMAYDHYDWYRCDLAAGETLKAEMRLDPAPTDMFALSILGADLSTLEGGMRTNYVDGTPPKLDRTVAVEKEVASAGVYYVVVMARVGLKDTVADLSDRNALSEYMLAMNMSAHAPGPANHPPLAKAPGASPAFDANTTYELELASLFEDPDGDALRYASTGNGSLRLNFSKPGTAVLAPDEYFVGAVNFSLNATDPEGLVAAVWVNATVRKVPFPPVIFDRSPASGALSGVNGTTLAFSVSARDPNHQMLTYAWSADGADLGQNANILSWKVPAASGAFVIRCTVKNADGNATAAWTVSAAAKPPLAVTIVTPLNNTAVKEGGAVSFYAVVSGLDPSALGKMSFEWTSGSRRLSTQAQFSTGALPAGQNVVEVSVVNTSDPAERGRATVVVFVEAKPASTDHTILIAAAVAAAVAAGLAYTVYRRGAAAARRGIEEYGDRARGRDRDRRRSRKKARKRSRR